MIDKNKHTYLVTFGRNYKKINRNNDYKQEDIKDT
jgi:hypothetical protein